MTEITLDDKYTRDQGLIYLTGTQALVRLPMEQHRLDAAAGLRTAGYVTGYRGSPLGGLDMAFMQARRFVQPGGIIVQPGVNEDLAATAVWGTQQTQAFGGAKVDGVFALWYGKGPGVDRSGDAFKHGNLAGSSPSGGVLLLAGDDHTCKSSTTAHQSEYAFVDAMIPVLAPANLREVIEFGLMGWAMSRATGCWVAMKLVTETVDSAGTIEVGRWGPIAGLPADFPVPTDQNFNLRWPDVPLAQEERLHRYKLPAATAFARANGLDRIVMDSADARLGIVTVGKSNGDVLQALDQFGIGPDEARRLGIRVCKVGLSWPLDRVAMRAFASGLEKIVVVEEKRGLVEDQLREALYGSADAPRIIGKLNAAGETLFPSYGDLDAAVVARGLHPFLAARAAGDETMLRRLGDVQAASAPIAMEPPPIVRSAYFCSGCPHNTSTKVPNGSRALAGIGCHYLVLGMERSTEGHTHMGAEGANWIGLAPFVNEPHVFQNMGDGTYFHSGLLAIRAAIASGVNVTYKLLFNDAVAMTGGQSVDGGLTVEAMVRQLQAEGAAKVVVVSATPDRFAAGALPSSVALRPREELDAVQQELRAVAGVTVLIYDQVCATEKRRRKKRAGPQAAPERSAVINELVCEGCGDCSVASNCLSVVPLETEFGIKRQIDQSSCNSDLSCVEGFCPSFVTVEGKPKRRKALTPGDFAASLPEPSVPILPAGGSYDILIAGSGGTGVVTVSALLGMAAHLAGRHVGSLDMTGLAQKGGAVSSHVRLANRPDGFHATRIAADGADLLLGCDLVVTASADTMSRVVAGRTRAVVNDHDSVTGAFTRHSTTFHFPQAQLHRRLVRTLGGEAVTFADTTRLAEVLLGDSIGANLMLLGRAWQLGLVPLPRAAIERAMELNGTAVEANKVAFMWGRLLAHDQDGVEALSLPPEPNPRPATKPAGQPESLDELIKRRMAFLTDYQNASYAARYERAVRRAADAEAKLPTPGAFTVAVARNLFKLMAYKDEYEVARLYTDTGFLAKVGDQFGANSRVSLHLAPPLFSRRDPSTGLPRKRAFGPWLFKVMAVLAPMKRLRGTPLDPFGYTSERRAERQLLAAYETLIDRLAATLTPGTLKTATDLAALPAEIRGFGHVKVASMVKVEGRRAALLRELGQSGPAKERPVKMSTT